MRTFLLLSVGISLGLQAQHTINGPMLGHVDMLEARIWLQCHGPCNVGIQYWNEAHPDSLLVLPVQQSDRANAHVLEFVADRLKPGTTYQYQVALNGRTIPFPEPLSFTTQPLWKFRTDPPPFTVAMGSCTYVNEPEYDRPGRPYGDGMRIFDAIADKNPDLMLWLGDNIYLREPDWGSRSGYLHRYTHTRSVPELQRLLRTTKHYAIWDDHDFGPNDADGSWVNSTLARETFDLFWANPTCGIPGDEQSVATHFSHADVDFFLLDNRTHRVPAKLKTGTPQMLGKPQLDWLIQALRYSDASFKLVAVGSQVLSTANEYENYATMPEERAELLRRIEAEGIQGVVFLTGDRHFTELSELRLKDGNVVHDLTVSPLTSGTYEPKLTNTNQVEGTLVTKRNFATLSFSGVRKERVMHIQVFDGDGVRIWEREIHRSKRDK